MEKYFITNLDILRKFFKNVSFEDDLYTIKTKNKSYFISSLDDGKEKFVLGESLYYPETNENPSYVDENELFYGDLAQCITFIKNNP